MVYDYLKCNMELNYSLLKENENCRLKVQIIYIGGQILMYMDTMGRNKYAYIGVVHLQLLLCVPQVGRTFFRGVRDQLE